MTFKLVAVLLLAASVSHSAGAEAGRDEASAGTIVVTAVGIKASLGGNMIVSLCRGKANWLDVDKSFLKKIIEATSDSIVVTFEGVPYDSSYAVHLIHDKNKNGRFDMRRFPYPQPKEGAGVSHNTFRSTGPPSYDKAEFAVSDSLTSIRIVMKY